MTDLAYADERAALAAMTADGYKLGEPSGGGRKRPRRGGVGGRKNPVTSGPQDAPTRPTMSSFRRFGGIGILILDATPPPGVVATALDMDTTSSFQALSTVYRPLRTSQWALLERAQRAEHVVALVICCDRPLLPEPTKWESQSLEAAVHTDAAIESARVYESHPEVLRLLDTLFEWLSFPPGKSQRRNVQLLCGAVPRRRNAMVLFTNYKLTQVAVD